MKIEKVESNKEIENFIEEEHQKYEAKKHFRTCFLLFRAGRSGTDRCNQIRTRKHP